jgi:hypothetical protein
LGRIFEVGVEIEEEGKEEEGEEECMERYVG